MRNSPLIGPKIPVHGLMLDVETGKLDWVVNGYTALAASVQPTMPKLDLATLGAAGSFKDFEMGEMKFPEMKIGEAAVKPLPSQPPQVRIVGTSVVEAPEATANQIAQVAEKNWPKVPPPTLPPLKKKSPPPPTIQPRPKFPGKY